MADVNEAVFIEKRTPDWRRLSDLTVKMDTRRSTLLDQEFHEFIRLYRAASSDLALVRTQSTNLALVAHLNQLVAEAYVVLYRPTGRSFGAAILAGIREFAQVVVRRRNFVFFAMAVFFAGAVFSSACLKWLPQTEPFLVDETVKQWQTKDGFGKRQGFEGIDMTSFYAFNNPRAALITGSSAASTCGVLTFYIVWSTGIQMGSLASVLAPAGRAQNLIATLPHGVTELQGLFMTAAAGFMMGWAIISPGRKKRSEALRLAMKDGIYLLGGGIVMMYMAAPIEGFFSYDDRFPLAFKGAMAVLMLAGWLGFYKTLGKQEGDPGKLPA